MIRVGAVSYLNTKPLIHGLRQRLAGIGELSLNLPSRLAQDLAAGKLDVALGLADVDAHGDDGVGLNDDAFDDFRARADEAAVFDDGGRGL